MPATDANAEESASHTTVLAFSGTTAVPSRTRALVDLVGRGLKTRGARLDVWDVAREALPIADPAHHARPDRHPDAAVRSLVRRAQVANAFVWGSPVYHNSYTGALKNLLDHLAIPQFERKPVGLVSHGAQHRSTQACDHLRLVARGLHAIAIPAQIITADTDFVLVDGAFRPSNEAILRRVAQFVDELLVLAERPLHANRPSSTQIGRGAAQGAR